MTTTVMIATQGNKAVTVDTPNGPRTLQPGQWLTAHIHGEQTISVKEVGEFIDTPPAATVQNFTRL